MPRTRSIYITVLIIVLFALHLSALGIQPKIYINEFQASNTATIMDEEFLEYSDWLELYNGEDTTVDLTGFYLTDDFQESGKWQIPANTSIPPASFLLFWADGNNTTNHTNFKLSKSAEQIALFSPDGALVDSISYGPQTEDFSYGRYPDGSGEWYLFNTPTPSASNTMSGYIDKLRAPVFSLSGGFYDNAQVISLVAEDSLAVIRYTTNGSIPDENSMTFTEAISVNQTLVIRAVAMRSGYLSSDIITHSFLINESTSLPVVCLATAPENLWDDETGIYVEGTNGVTGYCSSEPRNWNQPWEKPVSVEMYESDKELAFKLDAGMQIGGGCTRLYPQKTLAIYIRSKYGPPKLIYKLFADKPINRFNNFLLRNNGQDWWRAMLRDGVIQTIVKDKMDIDWQAYRPAILFLNGEYWGLHSIREKHNEHYLESNYGIDPDKIDILSANAGIKQGSDEIYNNMIDFIETNDMSQDENYRWVETQMDIDEYLNYVITEIYFANIDWPGGNIKYWRQHGDNHKWRWILFDTDLGFGAHSRGQFDSNNLENATSEEQTYYANPPWATLLLRKLLGNRSFQDRFIQRFASHLNTTFATQRVIAIIDSLRADIVDEIPRHIAKWPKSTSFNSGWEYHINKMTEFATKRPDHIIDHLTQKFSLSGMTELTIQITNPQMGSILVNEIEIIDQNFTGLYFKNVPLYCKAIPKAGYKFKGWEGMAETADLLLNPVLTGNDTLKAIFEIDETFQRRGLRINEVMAINDHTIQDNYGESDDWIELYNDSDEPVDIGGLYITDKLSSPYQYKIPENNPDSTTIAPGGFKLLWADKEPQQGILHLNIKLSGSGEAVGLSMETDSGQAWIDSLSFKAQTADRSLGRYPDGSDFLAVLQDPSPGYGNIYTTILQRDQHSESTIHLAQNFPNPFNSQTKIQYEIVQDNFVRLTVYDLAGKKVDVLLNERQKPGYYSITFDGKGLASGIYIYTIETGLYKLSRKMVLLQ